MKGKDLKDHEEVHRQGNISERANLGVLGGGRRGEERIEEGCQIVL